MIFVLVQGGSDIEQLLTQLTCLAGARQVIISEPYVSKRGVASSMGFNNFIFTEDVEKKYQFLPMVLI